MKTIIIASLLLVSFSTAFAQAPLGQPTPSLSDLDQQLQEVGCRAERQAAAQTIIQLRDQVATLQKQLAKQDPPKAKK